MLELARALARRGAAQAADLSALVHDVAAAYAPDAALASALSADLRVEVTTPAAKTAQLARAWAREQVRLALLEILERARARRLLRADGDAETLAWLWLAACEALPHEPPDAVPDRVHALVRFLTGE